MPRLNIVYVSVRSTDAGTMKQPAEDFAKETGIDVDMYCINDITVDEDPAKFVELIEKTKAADLVIVRCMTDPTRMKRWTKYEALLKEIDGYAIVFAGNVEIQLLYRELFKGDDGDFMKLMAFLKEKGAQNDRGIFCWLYNKKIGEMEIPEPFSNRNEGIYHPDMDRDVTFEEYMEKRYDPSKATVGVMLMANQWLYDNLRHTDALIREIERRGMNVIPVFFTPVIQNMKNEMGAKGIVGKYYMDDGKSRIDALIITTPFSQLNSSRDCNGIRTPDEQNFFHCLTDVPVFQAMSIMGHYEDYEESASGLSTGEFKMSVAWPEMDGQIITVPYGSNESKTGERVYSPIQDRIEHIAETVRMWTELRRKKPSERKVAIMLWQSRPESGRIGNAAGLDTIESVNDILIRLRKEGYTLDHVPESGRELVDEMLDNITNDLENVSSEVVRKRAAALVDRKEYLQYYNEIPEFNREQMEKSWGAPPGDVSTDNGKFVIPGIMNGNVFICYQPLRSWSDQMETLYHDPVLPIPHSYLMFYRWLKHTFKADMIYHMGTHGSLEWLPGKSVALSKKCFPNLVLDGIPNIYPYVIDDPGEGIICKRRAESVLVGHMCPIMTRGGSYDELSSIETPVQQYLKSRDSGGDKHFALLDQILQGLKKAEMFEELKIPSDITAEELEKHIDRINDHMAEIKDSLIRDGLHILGRPPEGELLDEAIYGMMRLRNGGVPSLRESFIAAKGYDPDVILNTPSGITDGMLNTELLDSLDSELMGFLKEMHSLSYVKEKCLELADKVSKVSKNDDLKESVAYVCDELSRNLAHMTDEMDNMMHGTDGGYVLPGPAGAPTRGNAHILPMGRNFYGIDPDIIPPPSSWEIGKKMADQMIQRYKDEKGCYPKEIGFIIWATDTMKTNGDDVAYILWLMGVRPVWSKSGGQVIDLEVIPISELGRPRIDVTVRITGLFRDSFPNLIELIDDAVKLVSNLDESDEENYLAANLRKDIIESITDGVSIDEARRLNSVRIFGCPPGGYGPGVNHAIESGKWETVQDLADIYVAWGSHAYGRGMSGESMKDQFVKRFSKVGVTVKNMPDREIDLLDIDDVYGYLGGMNSFVKAYGKQDVMSFMGDGSDPDKVKLRDTKEELQFVYRTKILNPKFIEGLKRHGYRGVSEIANLTEYTFGWDATSDIVDDWVYEKLTETYLFDPDTKQWMMEQNPHAMMDMMNRLMEAYERGMWDMKPETLEKMKELYLELEERIEEVNDRFQ